MGIRRNKALIQVNKLPVQLKQMNKLTQNKSYVPYFDFHPNKT